ncbi:Poly(A) RNA polymerase gld-2 [Sarcoptes scabiei]|uniref:Poly(A) RNA polymerase gld-2 n=1 Tax=Sarcoptes scabiei TaxID=52283 RepID=A0A834VCU2_SARSC|nr:Poly(A) RNA polymerase gld-2 [Sarcoptes scabiei]
MSVIKNLEYSIRCCNELIHLVYEKHRQRKEDYDRKLEVRELFYDLLNDNLDIAFDLYMVGSSQTQFSLRSSDMDLCMLVYDDQGRIDKRLIQNHETKLKLLMNARVPILKIGASKYFYQIAVDLNINGDVSIRNTFLLTFYQELDNRVAPLVVAVKSWAHKKQIDLPYRGTLLAIVLA